MHPEYSPEDIERFWSLVDRSGGPDACWPCDGSPEKGGYMRVTIGGQRRKAHRVAFAITHGRWPEPEGCHRCDNPPCCNPAHLFEGTQADNMADMVAKGRSLTGERHWANAKPELRLAGDDHWSKSKPERLARGDAHGTRTHPESRPRGDEHYTHRDPDLIRKGEQLTQARLTEDAVRAIRAEYTAGATMQALADKFGVTPPTVHRVVHRVTWRHVE